MAAAGIQVLADFGLKSILIARLSPGDPRSKSWIDTIWTMELVRGCLAAGAIAIFARDVGAFFNEPDAYLLIYVLAFSTAVSGFVNTGLFLLERRLDNSVYRAGFSTSRRQARQLVNHGHILVNDRKVDIPSYQVKPGDTISVREASRKNSHIEGAWQTASGRGRPSWITADGGDMSARIISTPVRDDIDRMINEQLIVELYSK